jgi:hypothetical protein
MLSASKLIAPEEYLDPKVLGAIARDDADVLSGLKPKELLADTGTYLAIAAREQKERAFHAILVVWGINPDSGAIRPGTGFNPHHLLPTTGVEIRGAIKGTFERVVAAVRQGYQMTITTGTGQQILIPGF